MKFTHLCMKNLQMHAEKREFFYSSFSKIRSISCTCPVPRCFTGIYPTYLHPFKALFSITERYSSMRYTLPAPNPHPSRLQLIVSYSYLYMFYSPCIYPVDKNVQSSLLFHTCPLNDNTHLIIQQTAVVSPLFKETFFPLSALSLKNSHIPFHHAQWKILP